MNARTALSTAILCTQLAGCACWAWMHGDGRSEVGVQISNESDRTICGVYIYRPEDVGGTGIVASSPEMNNVLARGTYMVAEEHPKALQPGTERAFRMRVGAADRFDIRARNCDDEVVFEQNDVCMARGLTLKIM